METVKRASRPRETVFHPSSYGPSGGIIELGQNPTSRELRLLVNKTAFPGTNRAVHSSRMSAGAKLGHSALRDRRIAAA
jgi:hypothetical protein